MVRVLLVTFVILFTLVSIHGYEVQGQALDVSISSTSSRDSLSTASALFDEGNYRAAYWYCISLFDNFPREVTELICRRRHEVDNIPLEIKMIFDSLCTLDTTVTAVTSGKSAVDANQLVFRARLVDNLIFAVERELISRYFIDAFAADLMKDFIMVDSAVNDDQIARIIDDNSKIGESHHRRFNFRSRDGLSVKGFDGRLYDRVQIDVVTAESSATISSLVDAILDSKYIRLPLVNGPDGYAKSPPCVMIESAGVLVMISEHCENYYRSDGSMEEDVFWSKAAHWVSLIAGVHPKSILAWNCGGPVREMH